MQSSVDPEYQRMNKERSQAAAARNRTLQVPTSATSLMPQETAVHTMGQLSMITLQVHTCRESPNVVSTEADILTQLSLT